MNIIEVLKSNRPNLSASSLKTYNSVLTSLMKKIVDPDEVFDIKLFDNVKKIMPVVEVMKNPKTLLAALFVLTEKPEYKVVMDKKIEEHNDEEKLQTKNEKQETNMITKTEVHALLNNMKNKVSVIYKNNDVSSKSINVLVNYILLCLVSGVYMEPRRSMDWVLMKTKLEDDTAYNYYDKKNNKFIFNKYKTSKTYKQQAESVPKELSKIINKYIGYVKDINKTDFLLFNISNNGLTAPEIAMRLNKMFGKNISTSMLRHIFLSDKFASMPSIIELQKTASAMGHSIPQMLEYIKK